MPIKFKRKLFHQKILDPNDNYQPAFLPIEIRWDTLTGHTGIIQEFRFRGKLPPPDYGSLIEKTQPICPFCPGTLEKGSPRFPPEFIPEGQINYKGITVIPNFNPYATYSAIAILSPSHFLRLTEFTEDIVVNGLLACQEYLQRVAAHDSGARYISINWNYLPPSGGSVIHPHLQPIASLVAPTYERETLAASRKYFRKNGSIYWEDLIKAEKEQGERFVGESGNIAWVVNFTGRGREPDILGIFQKKYTILDLEETDFTNFFSGLKRVFQFMIDRNYASFNLALYSAPRGQDHYRVHARLKPRFQFHLIGTADYCFVEALHDDFLCASYPEKVCRELIIYF